MASEETYGGVKGLEQSPFVEKVMPDPSKPTSVIPWVGLLGKSSEDGYWRLYLTIELDSYIEFKEEDVLAFDIIPAEQSRLGVEAARVYLKPEARIRHVYMQSWEGYARQERAGVPMAARRGQAGVPMAGPVPGYSRRGVPRGRGTQGGVVFAAPPLEDGGRIWSLIDQWFEEETVRADGGYQCCFVRWRYYEDLLSGERLFTRQDIYCAPGPCESG
jgi:hypothetical protein